MKRWRFPQFGIEGNKIQWNQVLVFGLNKNKSNHQLKDHLDKHQKEYDAFRQNMKKEYEIFEARKQADFRKALDHYVKTQISFESQKLQAMEDLLATLKEEIIS